MELSIEENIRWKQPISTNWSNVTFMAVRTLESSSLSEYCFDIETHQGVLLRYLSPKIKHRVTLSRTANDLVKKVILASFFGQSRGNH